jgi:tetratricopeptide (TPR) repeat protein
VSESFADTATGEIARLEALVGGDPGSPAFSALAEAQRRAGLPSEAERTARAGLRHRPDQVAGRVALGLALIDLGRLEDARLEFERVLELVPDQALAAEALRHVAGQGLEAPETASGDAAAGGMAFESIDDDELDDAFDQAETEADELVDADDIARQAMRTAALDQPEGIESEPASPFATQTMADLLEQQGLAEDARALRESIGVQPRGENAAPHGGAMSDTADLESEAPPSASASMSETGSSQARQADRRAAAIRTLERWLENLGRGNE